jgi:hypothetical protein
MRFVIGKLEPHIQEDENEAGHADGKSHNIDEGE